MDCKKRNIFLCILFSIISFGIYYLYWRCKITTETNNLATNNKSANGFLALVLTAITFGIYGFYWAYKLGNRVGEIEGGNGSGGLYVVLTIFAVGAIVIPILAQSAINKKAA